MIDRHVRLIDTRIVKLHLPSAFGTNAAALLIQEPSLVYRFVFLTFSGLIYVLFLQFLFFVRVPFRCVKPVKKVFFRDIFVVIKIHQIITENLLRIYDPALSVC